MLVVKTGVFTALMLFAVLSVSQKTPIQRAPKFKWGQGQPQKLEKSLAEYNISTEDRAAILQALGPEFRDDPNPPSPTAQAEKTLVDFIDLNGDGTLEVIAQPVGNFCGAANCPLYVLQKIGTKYETILRKGAAQGVLVQSTRTNGYLDVVVTMHGSATETGLFVYQFSKGRYQRTHCYDVSFEELGTDGEIQKLDPPRVTPCR